MRFISFAIALYLTGCFVFLHKADWNKEIWVSSYYIWDKAKDLLLFISIYFLVAKNNRYILWPIIVYSGIRVAWEVVSLILKIDINTKPSVSVLLSLVGIIYVWIFLKELPKWQKQK